MTYLLDTNTIIARLNGHAGVAARLEALAPDEVPVLAELHFGALLSARSQENLERIDRLVGGLRFHPFGAGAARRFGAIKAVLRRRGIAKSDFDLAIAAIALDLSAILVSSDRAFHDGAIDGLQAETWVTGT